MSNKQFDWIGEPDDDAEGKQREILSLVKTTYEWRAGQAAMVGRDTDGVPVYVVTVVFPSEVDDGYWVAVVNTFNGQDTDTCSADGWVSDESA